MTTKEALHHLVEELPDEQTDLACALLEDLRNAADIDGPPLDVDARVAGSGPRGYLRGSRESVE